MMKNLKIETFEENVINKNKYDIKIDIKYYCAIVRESAGVMEELVNLKNG